MRLPLALSRGLLRLRRCVWTTGHRFSGSVPPWDACARCRRQHEALPPRPLALARDAVGGSMRRRRRGPQPYLEKSGGPLVAGEAQSPGSNEQGGACLHVFACAGCGTELTAPVSRVALPVHSHHGDWEELHPPLTGPATYAVDPRPTGPPWRLWEEVGKDAAAWQDGYAPVYSVSFDARNRIVITSASPGPWSWYPKSARAAARGWTAGPASTWHARDVSGPWRPAWTIADCGRRCFLGPDAVARRPSGLPAASPPDWDAPGTASHPSNPTGRGVVAGRRPSGSRWPPRGRH